MHLLYYVYVSFPKAKRDRMNTPTNRTWVLDRRGFLRVAATAGVAATAVALGGCETYGEVVTGERTIVDDANRELRIPAADKLERIYFTSGLAQVWVFSLNPDKQGGTSAQFSARQREFLPEGIADLEYMGAIGENASIDTEMLAEQDIQLVFSISGIGLTEGNISDAERLQEQTGIPVVLVDGSFDRIATAYRFVGDIMGEQERAEELATYCEQKFAEVTAAVAQVPEEEKVRLYYAEGVEGLQTDPPTSQHALTFELAGAINVADCGQRAWGMTQVDMERVLSWDPEVIIAWDEEEGGCDETIRQGAEWQHVKAVRNNQVFRMPMLPFSWCDRPPGVNRLIGIMWVANLLYPTYYNVDMVEVTKEFYKTMYWADITDDQARELLSNSYPPPEKIKR